MPSGYEKSPDYGGPEPSNWERPVNMRVKNVPEYLHVLASFRILRRVAG